jgi:glycine/D-amino acid oxidase-like deaminating enzyme
MRSTEVDVAILEGGYSGLWTAYYLLHANLGFRVTILEKEMVCPSALPRPRIHIAEQIA